MSERRVRRAGTWYLGDRAEVRRQRESGRRIAEVPRELETLRVLWKRSHCRMGFGSCLLTNRRSVRESTGNWSGGSFEVRSLLRLRADFPSFESLARRIFSIAMRKFAGYASHVNCISIYRFAAWWVQKWTALLSNAHRRNEAQKPNAALPTGRCGVLSSTFGLTRRFIGQTLPGVRQCKPREEPDHDGNADHESDHVVEGARLVEGRQMESTPEVPPFYGCVPYRTDGRR